MGGGGERAQVAAQRHKQTRICARGALAVVGPKELRALGMGKPMSAAPSTYQGHHDLTVACCVTNVCPWFWLPVDRQDRVREAALPALYINTDVWRSHYVE